VKAGVCCRGRPDLAQEDLGNLRAPALMRVGGLDEPLEKLNQDALGKLPPRQEERLTVVPGASEADELKEVVHLAGE
jgi:putative phosphoribosyl transferase